MKPILMSLISYFVILNGNSEVDYKKMLHNTCKAYEAMRTPNGLYLDSIFKSKERMKGNFRVSSASTGIGLISLCIAEKSRIGENNAAKALLSLRTLNGKSSLKLERNTNGLFKHFFSYKDAKSYGSEYSTIDTALLISGALFCKNTFKENNQIAAEVKELWQSINWQSCRINKTSYWLKQDQQGKGSGQTRMFNEYLLLADFCYADSPIDINNLTIRTEVEGFEILSDLDFRPLPLFTFHFPLYLSPIRTNDPTFLKEVIKAVEADKAWWTKQTGLDYVWGSSAGQDLKGYGVNSSKDNPAMIINFPSVAAMLPFDKKYHNDATAIINKHPKIIFNYDAWQIPWRASVKHKNWQAPAIQGIDLAPLLLGLAALDINLGFQFFRSHSQINID